MKNTKKISKKKYRLEIGIWTGAWYIDETGRHKEIEFILEYRSNNYPYLSRKYQECKNYGRNIGYARVYDNQGNLVGGYGDDWEDYDVF